MIKSGSSFLKLNWLYETLRQNLIKLSIKIRKLPLILTHVQININHANGPRTKGSFAGPWGYSYVKVYRDVSPKWVTLLPTILRHGSHFGQKWPPQGKILRRGFHFTKIVKKNCKISHFGVEKPLEMGPNLRKFWKERKISHFLREKNPRPHTLSKNNLSTPSASGFALYFVGLKSS